LNIHTIILAGGKGTRMLSQKAKVLQALGGRTMLNHVMTAANKISNKISVVVGFDKEGVECRKSKKWYRDKFCTNWP
jgi:bifunctional UDP-N-acetylglucosamine pyrophosphorylase/glucosamine-1-phosphate N-acetyltransferase